MTNSRPMDTTGSGTMSTENITPQANASLSPAPAIWVTAMPYLAALFPVAIVFQLSAVNVPTPAEILSSVGILLALTAAAHLLLAFLIHNSPKRELTLLIVVGLFGPAGFFLLLIHHSMHLWVALCLSILGLMGIVVTLKSKTPLTGSRVPALFVLFLVVGIGLQLILGGSRLLPDIFRINYEQSDQYILNTVCVNHRLPPIGELDEVELPDIYYLILDAYGRADVLQQFYGLDNSAFLGELQRRGFVIPSRSRSNYHLTDISVASALNMSYLNSDQLQHFATRLPIRSLISDSAFVRILKQHGYQTIGFESGKSATECKTFDTYVATSNGLSEFQDLLFHSTAASFLLQSLDSYVPYFPTYLHRKRLINTFDSLPVVTREASSPSFVLSHIMAPHPPFVFDEHGNPRNIRGRYLLADAEPFHALHGRTAYVDGYSRQLHHINSLVLQTIDRIHLLSSRPVVIVLQGDHGPRSRTNVSNFDASDMQEAFGILLAVCVPPDKMSKLEIYDEITPVNTFRQILNVYFGTELEILKDRCYFESPIYSYQFRDVTAMTNSSTDLILPDR